MIKIWWKSPKWESKCFQNYLYSLTYMSKSTCACRPTSPQDHLHLLLIYTWNVIFLIPHTHILLQYVTRNLWDGKGEYDWSLSMKDSKKYKVTKQMWSCCTCLTLKTLFQVSIHTLSSDLYEILESVSSDSYLYFPFSSKLKNAS